MHFTSLTALVTCSLLPTAFGATWKLSQTWVGTDILSAFEHEAIADPTHGRVNYVDQATALSQNLTYAHGDTYVLRADHTTVLDPNGAGRNSVRIKSTATFDHHVAVFDVQHMPEGCGTWPAIWETNEATWPNDGEIDLVEGVNNQGTNLVSLHTSAGCTVPASRAETGTPNSLDCVAADNGNTGCNVQAADAKSFGPSFNAVGGGWYAVERSSTAIKAWFFPRDGGKPSDIGSGTINTDNWGTPVALFPNTSCDIDSHFGENNIIINLTFCGDWAGSVYGNSGCPSTCVDYVNNNPGAFTNAYFEINSIRVYE